MTARFKTMQVLYAECIINPTMCILDVEAFGALGRSLPGVLTIADATFATPYLLQPIRYGVDVVLHSWYRCNDSSSVSP